MNKCNHCQDKEATILVTNDGTELFCNSCFNDMISEDIGLTLETIPKEVAVFDYSGERRYFTLQQRLYPTGIFLEATEGMENGYQVAVHGELDCNQTELFHKLIDKVKTYVSRQFIKVEEYPNGQTYNSIIGNEVVGRIDHDETSPSLPMIVIDGEPYTWEELGEMVKSFEGFQFQMKFFDMTDNVE